MDQVFATWGLRSCLRLRARARPHWASLPAGAAFALLLGCLGPVATASADPPAQTSWVDGAPLRAAMNATVIGSRPGDDAPAPDDPSAVLVIDLRQPGTQGPGRTASLAELVRGEPGVGVRSIGGLGQWSGASLRGSASNQVAILVDGVPLQSGGMGTVDLSTVPVDGVERVEIYRGVPPLALGIDSIGGAINVVTRRGGVGPGAWASGSSGSFGLRKLAGGVSTGRAGPLRAAASASYAGATGDFPYYDTEGLRYSDAGQVILRRNDGFDQVAADARLDWEDGPTALRVYGHGLVKQQGVPGIAQVGVAPGDPTLRTGRAALGLGAARRLLGGRAALEADAYGVLDSTVYRDRAVPAHTEGLVGQVGGQAQVHVLGPVGRIDLRHTLLLDGRYEVFRSADLCPAPQRDCAQRAPTTSSRGRLGLALGGDQRFFGDRVLVQPGMYLLYARSVLHNVAGSSLGDVADVQPRDDWFFAPRIGVRVRLLQGLIARASGGRFVRLPTFLETFGDQAFFRPSPGLLPESAWSLEAGLRQERRWGWGQVTAELTGSARVVDHLIDVIRNGALLQARNVGQARMLGLEATAEGSLGRVVLWRLSYSFLDARDLSDVPSRYGKLLPGRPQHSVFGRLELRRGPWRAFYEVDFASVLYLDPANYSEPRPARTLHAVGGQIGPLQMGRSRLSLGIEVRNLLDTRVVSLPVALAGAGQQRLFPLVDFIDNPLPGRAVYATLSGQL